MTEKSLNPFAEQRTAVQSVGSNSDAQRAIAEVQAKLMIARAQPRDEKRAVDRIINAFCRASLAEQSQYAYSKGGTDISGPSIRSAEAMAQLWGNIEFGFRELSRGVGDDGTPFSEVEAFGWDLETNTRRPVQFRVPHWRDTKKGGYKITDERDIYELVSNQAQRRVRACILALIPGDVQEAAMNQAEVTLKASADTTPEGIKKLVEAFAAFGVTKEQIEKRIQRRVDTIQPAQVMSMKKIYASLRDGMSAVEDWFEVNAEPETLKNIREDIAKAKQPAAPADKPKAKEPPPPKSTGGMFALTAGDVRAMLQSAKTLAELELAADVIRELHETERPALLDYFAELKALFHLEQ